MEEQEKQLALQINKEVEKNKQAAWGKLGVQVYHSEIRLQLQAQQIASKLLKPKTFEEIADAEAALKDVKNLHKILIESRKEITSRLDVVAKKLMAPENELIAAIEKNINDIINIKRDKEEHDRKQALKQKELKEVQEKVLLYVADMHSAYLNAQANLLSTAYTYALEKNIPLTGITEYKKQVMTRVTLQNRTTPLPKIVAIYNTQEVIDAEIKKHFNPWTPEQYVIGFEADLCVKFDDWELALKNKEQAAKIDKEELDKNTSSIQQQKQQETIAAKLNTYASDVQVSDIKQLKKVYTIEPPIDLQSALKIISAFCTNIDKVQNKLQLTIFDNLSIKQMRQALGKLKTEDENFNITNIEFKQTEKL